MGIVWGHSAQECIPGLGTVLHVLPSCLIRVLQPLDTRISMCEWIDSLAAEFEWKLARASSDIALRQGFASKPMIELSVPTLSPYII